MSIKSFKLLNNYKWSNDFCLDFYLLNSKNKYLTIKNIKNEIKILICFNSLYSSNNQPILQYLKSVFKDYNHISFVIITNDPYVSLFDSHDNIYYLSDYNNRQFGIDFGNLITPDYFMIPSYFIFKNKNLNDYYYSKDLKTNDLLLNLNKIIKKLGI